MRTELIDYDPDPQREDEITREQRWDDFIAWLRQRSCARDGDWHELLAAAADGLHSMETNTKIVAYTQPFVDFAESEGWPGVLSALARAMREDEQARRELMDRR